MTQALGRYALVLAATVAAAAWVLTFALSGDGAGRAILISAFVAAAVQIGAFAISQSLVRTNLVAAWGAGSLVRFVALVVYALVAVKVMALPALPALLSLFVFFFLSMLLEPLFLRR
jgi:hypothetical protein